MVAKKKTAAKKKPAVKKKAVKAPAQKDDMTVTRTREKPAEICSICGEEIEPGHTCCGDIESAEQ